jgi:hypothetical protein
VPQQGAERLQEPGIVVDQDDYTSAERWSDQGDPTTKCRVIRRIELDVDDATAPPTLQRDRALGCLQTIRRVPT